MEIPKKITDKIVSMNWQELAKSIRDREVYIDFLELKSNEKVLEDNKKLRLGLGKLLKICLNTKMHLKSEVWQQQIGIAKEMYESTDPK